jgi:PBSX family phage terminase large subunit
MDEASQIVESWEPPLSPKQKKVFDCYKRYILCTGGRRNGKTLICANRVFKHMVEIPGARVALIATTIKSAKEGGAFADITDIVYPIWYEANIHGAGGRVEYTTERNGLPGPVMDSATRTMSFRIRNIHGGESELILFSIDNEKEVEAITKSKRFSMVWLSEGSNFKSPQLFKNLVQMLRMVHIPEAHQQLIVDTNPAEEGDEHWIYKKWFVERLMDAPPNELKKTEQNPSGLTQEDWEIYKQDFACFEFQLEDNPFLSKRDIAELKASNCDNQGEYDRNILGKWVKGFGLKGKVFADIIDVGKHFVRGAIDVDPYAIKMLGGWDMGRVNHAGCIVEPRMYKERLHYMILDEVITIGEEISTQQFAIMMYEKMRTLEHFYQKRFNWIHWSDNSAWNFNPSSADIDATIVANVTEGEVELQAANKAKDSVNTGIKIMRQLIKQDRLFVGSNCPKIQEMLVSLTERDIEDDTHFKHPFDALRYVIYMEERGHYLEHGPKGIDREMKVIHFA